ncbi:M20/M25/M40 family metallo-hydrolase [Lacicoccus alkaliphilus]|uniref:Arginine utilization protein RocB n=1 Tax=Lacicoccus alkaliphilus DSM 16010 TaxID=1123231 RepID=A0A1M7JI42_9BACL|nr:M20/M25/M40 family metallo-hydrolase [Salinicoccus alkaliphilus]SHM52616.1 Arginine utilization protein RocB [Salinicoccus alkaliphilus DSM 16010]
MEGEMEKLECRDEILAITKKLVGIRSEVNTEGERALAETVHDMLKSHPYFEANPSQLVMEPTVNDERERYNVMAYVKGTKGNSNRTVVLMGHMDTVGVEDFGVHQELAFKPDEWKAHLKSEPLPETVQTQAASDDWMFGRGVLDMKSGVASNLYLLSHYASNPELLEGNLVLIVECDEEDGSHGILSALKTLKRWQAEEGFDYVAAINADFVAPAYAGDENRYIYKGTVGKLLPSFFITGEETHVGSAFDGLDPNFIAAELTRQISYNPGLSDMAFGEATLPPVSLKQTDLKPNYTVQTALSAYVYYNFFVHSWSPEKVLELLKEQAHIAFRNALDTFEARYRKYNGISDGQENTIQWEPRVYTYDEMEELLKETHGEVYVQHMNAFKEKLEQDESLDSRMLAARVVEEAWQFMPDKRPAIIVFYSSLYSPRVALKGEDENERTLLDALDKAIEAVQPEYEHPIVAKNFFPHISDMSFVAMSDDMPEIDDMIRNTPSWGKKLSVEYQDVADLNIPVINIGPYGMDGHKRLERMEMTYSLEMVPNLTNRVIRHVLESE